MLNIESAFLLALIIKSAHLSALIIVDVIFFDVSHTPQRFPKIFNLPLPFMNYKIKYYDIMKMPGY